MRKLWLLFCLALISNFVAGCSVDRRRGSSGNGDGFTKFGDGGVLMSCDSSHPCPTGDRCFENVCIPDNGTCSSDNDCENDSYCDCANVLTGTDGGACTGGVCVPWGDPPRGPDDPACSAGFSIGAFAAPVVKCQWQNPTPGGSSDVIMTPLVIDLDGDKKPEIVFAVGDSNEQLTAIHGDCTPFWVNTTTPLTAYSQIAAADLDGDGVPEIVGITTSGVTVFDNKGTVLASAALAGPVTLSVCDGPAIADVDNIAPPEILIDGTVLRYVKGQTTLTTLFTNQPPKATWGLVSLFADLDGDKKPEVVAGVKIYDGVTGADKTPTAMSTLPDPTLGGYSAIADFNGDGKPDVVTVQSAKGMQQVSILDYANNKIIFGPYTVAGGGWGGPPTVGDYDGDGVPDFGLASSANYFVYALKCAATPKPADCTGTDPGVLWERPTHDTSSGGTASSTFDFNGDGIAEVVYRDECWLRVYNGPNGKAIFAQNITSGTCLEYPVIADIDNDGHADLVVPSDNVQMGFMNCPVTPEVDTMTPWTGYTSGIFVLRDPMNRWMPSRPLWTQHTYHVTEINDDLSVPTIETPSWTAYNTYRKNVQGKEQGAGGIDATAGMSTGTMSCGATTLTANVCDRGAAPIPAGMPGTFYTSDPRMPGATIICTVMTIVAIQPGDCALVQCEWPNAPTKFPGVWFRANDNGTTQDVDAECKTGNDLLYIPPGACGPVE